MSKSGFSLNEKKNKLSLILEQRLTNSSSNPILMGEVSRNLVDYHTHASDEQLRRDQLHEQLSKQNRDLREAHMKSLNEIEGLKRVQGSTFDTFSRKLIEDRDTILDLTAKIQELQSAINRMNDSRDFQDAESVRSGQSHVTSQPVFPLFQKSLWNAEPFCGNAATKGRQAFGTRMVYRELCCKSNGVFFSSLSVRDQPMDL